MNFEFKKPFFENCKPIRVWFWLVYKIAKNNCGLWFLYPWQNKYSNLNTTCHIKPKFFFWSKLFWNFLLTNYIESVNWYRMFFSIVSFAFAVTKVSFEAIRQNNDICLPNFYIPHWNFNNDWSNSFLVNTISLKV